MIQENRTFDNLFATFPGAKGTTQGKIHTGSTVKLAKHALLDTTDVMHAYSNYLTDYDHGKMDGFDLDPTATGRASGLLTYQYVAPEQIAVYWTLAKRYVLADQMFTTQGSDSFIGHQDLIAGSTQIDAQHAIVNAPNASPWGCDAPAGTVTSLVESDGTPRWNKGPFPCLNYPTLAGLLDAKGLTWRYYADYPKYSWNAFEAIRAVRYASQWNTNVSTPQTTIFRDIRNGTLPAVSWVVPAPAYSDHPGEPQDFGPDWVGNVVNAVGESPYWRTTAIIVVWDDWGGFYDHLAPPRLNFGGLGFRVPMIAISAYARTAYVSHTQYEFASILRFVEDNWHLGRLGTNDRRANSIGKVFDFSQKPKPYVPVKVGHSRAFFLTLPPSNRPLDSQ
jgi:phospholipase C